MQLEAEIRNRSEAFANELSVLVKRVAIAAMKEALEDVTITPARRRRARSDRELPRATRPYVMTPARRAEHPTLPSSAGSALPLSFDAYERAAYQRAISETGGDLQAAAKLLGIGKTTIYRRVAALGVRVDGSGKPPFVTDEPVSLENYERLVWLRALDQAGGDAQAAAKLLGVGKSTIYRWLAKHETG